MRRDSFGRDRPYHDRKRRRSPSPYNDMPDPLKLDYFMPFPVYADYLKEKNRKRYMDEDLQQMYDSYKETFTIKAQERFFHENKDAGWFREKYHPVESLPFVQESIQHKKQLLETFLKCFENGEWDDVRFDFKEDFTIPSQTHALFIKTIPLAFKKSDLEASLKDEPGYRYLCLTDPRPDKKMSRVGWIVFDSSVDLNEKLTKLDGSSIGEFTLHLALHEDLPAKIKQIPPESSRPARLLHDYNQAKTLAQEFDSQLGVEGVSNILSRLDRLNGPLITHLEATEAIENGETTDENENLNVAGIKQYLDAIILYLRKVHCYDYYTGVEASMIEDFERKSLLSLRLPFSDYRPSGKESFMDRLDARIMSRLEPPTPQKIHQKGGQLLEQEITKELQYKIRKESEGKYRCTVCSKLFKGEEYVVKHISSKHPEVTESVQERVAFFNNYVLDFDKVDPLKSNPRNSRSSVPSRPRPPPRDARSDPRSIRSYRDLDAPMAAEVELNYD